MPRVADVPLHRIHIRLDAEDYEWLKSELGDERLISETIRKLVRELRNRRKSWGGSLPPIDQLMTEIELENYENEDTDQ
jgi:hypothetical protein